MDTTPLDWVILVDACHIGDPSLLAPLFLGSPCGFAATDGGIDLIPGNDGPVTQDVNVTTHIRALAPP